MTTSTLGRKEALQFMLDNSRCIRSTHLNPISKAEKKDDPDYEPHYLEQRIGNNGTTFCLLDMGKNGWDLYLPVGGNEVASALEAFCKATGAILP